jgi:hypothetical protein
VKIWLDDERDPVVATGALDWAWVRTVPDCIGALRRCVLAHVEISLDHDLGTEPATGYDVLTWIEERVRLGHAPPRAIHIHTANPAARMRMIAARAAILRTARPR